MKKDFVDMNDITYYYYKGIHMIAWKKIYSNGVSRTLINQPHIVRNVIGYIEILIAFANNL